MQPLESGISDPYPPKFTLFPKLPPELRLKIWKHALPNGANDDGERILTVDINIVKDDPVTGLDINFTVTTEGEDVMSHSQEPEPEPEPEDALVEAYLEDLNNVTLLSTCVESRDVVLEAFKNTLPIGKNGVLRFDNDALICILNWSRKEIRDPIRKALAARLPVPACPIRNFTTIPNIFGLSLVPGDGNNIGNLSILQGLETITFNQSVEQHLLRVWAPSSAEPQVDAYLQWILENMREQKIIDPQFKMPKLGLYHSKKKKNAPRYFNWATLTMDTSAFQRARGAVAASVERGF